MVWTIIKNAAHSNITARWVSRYARKYNLHHAVSFLSSHHVHRFHRCLEPGLGWLYWNVDSTVSSGRMTVFNRSSHRQAASVLTPSEVFSDTESLEGQQCFSVFKSGTH